MNRQSARMIDQAKEAAFQDHPFILITLSEKKLSIACQGREAEIINALRNAVAVNPQFASIINKVNSPITQINQTVIL